jgi:uncharacterized protein YrrD
MAIESVTIGSHVWARDGQPLGRVTRFVVDPAAWRLDSLVVDRGPFSTERLVDVTMVDRSAHDEVFLSVGGDKAGPLPPFVKREMAQVDGPLMAPVHNSAVVWDPYEGDGVVQFQEVTGDSLYELAPMGTVITDTISSVPEGSVVIDKGTEVVTADGFTAGHLHGLVLDGPQRVTGIVMTAGLLYKHHVRVPLSQAAQMSHNRILLTLGWDEATDAVNEADIQPA